MAIYTTYFFPLCKFWSSPLCSFHGFLHWRKEVPWRKSCVHIRVVGEHIEQGSELVHTHGLIPQHTQLATMSPLWHNAPRTVDFWKIVQFFLSYLSSNNNWHHGSNHMPCGAGALLHFLKAKGGKRNSVKQILYSDRAQGTYYNMTQTTWNMTNPEKLTFKCAKA